MKVLMIQKCWQTDGGGSLTVMTNGYQAYSASIQITVYLMCLSKRRGQKNGLRIGLRMSMKT